MSREKMMSESEQIARNMILAYGLDGALIEMERWLGWALGKGDRAHALRVQSHLLRIAREQGKEA